MSLVLIRGAGDVGTAVGIILHSLGYQLVYTELPQPTALRWAVAFSEAIYRNEWKVAGILAKRVFSAPEAREIAEQGMVAVIAPEGGILRELRPEVLIDARMAKHNLGTRIEEAPLVIGLGPGFVARQDCHAVVETLEGPDLGRVLLEGSAASPTHQPCLVGEWREERVLRAPRQGPFSPLRTLGERVAAGEVVAWVGEEELKAPIPGVIRGILHPGLTVRPGMKVAEIDPRGDPQIPFQICTRSLRIAEGVVKALKLLRGNARPL
ncbi:MAG: selenium-dependent molybdenum cofactor biosynthesis protein YqeB [Candidatus Bipolaricaulaceae bacterium]